jgi:hypothetical protein
MATNPQYEIKDIKITPDGNNFRVIVQSDFVVDEYGQRKDEMFQYPIKLLENEEKWKGRINSVMIRRAVDEEEEDENDRTTPAGGFQTLSPTEKRINRLNRLNSMKEKHIGTVDVAKEVAAKKEIRALETATLKKATDTEGDSAKGGDDNAKA